MSGIEISPYVLSELLRAKCEYERKRWIGNYRFWRTSELLFHLERFVMAVEQRPEHTSVCSVSFQVKESLSELRDLLKTGCGYRNFTSYDSLQALFEAVAQKTNIGLTD